MVQDHTWIERLQTRVPNLRHIRERTIRVDREEDNERQQRSLPDHSIARTFATIVARLLDFSQREVRSQILPL